MLKSIKSSRKWAIIIIHALVFNLASGVSVAGIDAGKVFNTWPSMNGSFVPTDYYRREKGILNLFENCATV